MPTSDRTTPESIMLAFNDAINARDLDRVETLMTEDHLFIDTGGNRLAGKQQALRAWRGFFASFAEYRNVFERLAENGQTDGTPPATPSVPYRTSPRLPSIVVGQGCRPVLMGVRKSA